MTITDMKQDPVMKPDKSIPINDNEIKMLRSDAGKLAWLATGSTPLASFQASVPLQGGKDSKKTIQTLIDTRGILKSVQQNDLSSITYQTWISIQYICVSVVLR